MIEKFTKDGFLKGQSLRESPQGLSLEKNSPEIKTEKLLLQAQLEDRISFYKTLIRGYFALKKSVFIVLPTEYDIEIFQQALSKGIENFTFRYAWRIED